jgi:class 3 adenylate cyclase/tetratricopeptide (TPR) repeat protein
MPSPEQASSRPERSPAASSRGERKFAVALFADLSGYTALCRQLDPEDVELTVAPLMTTLRATVVDEGGVIANVAGDGFFALFGVPLAFADAPSRAVRAAERVRDVVTARNAEPGLPRIPDVHVGIASGEVLVTPSEDAPGWSVIGSAINLASRLCDAAGPGEVLVDDDTRRLVGGQNWWAGSRDLAVHGHDHPVSAWELKAIEPTAPLAYGDVPFVNRSDVLAYLSDCWTSVNETSRSRVIVIDAEPGLGKSRTVDHWLTLHAEATSLWLRCGGAVGSQSVLRLIDLLVDQTGEPSADVRALLEMSPSAAPVGISPDRFPMALETARRLLLRATAAAALILVVDDVHAADPTLRDAIKDIREHRLDAPLLVLCTQRTGEAESLPVDVVLDPLPVTDAAEILTAALGAPPPPSVRDALLSRVGGHPLMAVQSAAYLLEAGLVTIDADVCVVRSPDAVDVLPSSLRLYVSARLDALPANDKAFLQELSTIGDAADADWIRTVFGPSAEARLDAARARGFLTRTDGDWRFSHGVVQEVAYASLTRRARADLHRRQLSLIAENTQQELRSYHAVAWAQSVGTLGSSADPGAGVAALRETLDLARVYAATQARSAHELIHRNRSVVEDAFSAAPDLAIQLLTLDAECLIELGRFEEALQSTTRAEVIAAEAAVSTQARISCLLARGHALSRLRRFQSARQALDAATALAEQIPDQSLRAYSLLLNAQTWRHSDYAKYVSLTEEAYDVFDAAGDAAGAAECARLLAYLTSASSAIRYQRWAAIARCSTADNDVCGQAWLARAAQIAYGVRLDFANVETEALKAIDYGQRSGLQDAVMEGIGTLIEARLGLGKLAEAVSTVEQLIEVVDAQNNQRARLTAGAVAAPVLLRAGFADRAQEELHVARDQLAEFGASELYQVSVGEAQIARDRGEWERALARFDEVAGAVSESGAAGLFLLAQADQARSRLQAGQQVPLDALEHLRDECRRLDAPIFVSMIDALIDRAQLLDGTLAKPSASAVRGCLEELAIRAETAALLAEVRGEPSDARWRSAADAWRQLGFTIFLARAQSRSGDVEEAEHTLDVLRASEPAREWALGQVAPA